MQTINLLTPLANITKSVTIQGPGANLLTVRRDDVGANTEFRVFNIPLGVANGVAISGMTISGGRATGSFGGGIYSQSYLALTNVHLTGNQAAGGGGVSLGRADGVFTGCTFSSNTAVTDGGGIFYQGDDRTLRLINCRLAATGRLMRTAVLML